MPTRIVESLEEVSAAYDLVLCDIWGCYHNGIEPYPAAVEALTAFRRRGGKVALLTNAPRPAASVRRHLDRMGAPHDSYDLIVTSGDAAKAAVADGDWGRRVYHIGPERDLGFFEGIDIELVGLEEAEGIVCTGLFDDNVETPEDYVDTIAAGVRLGLRFLCANPDLVVDRGEERLYCAGAIAKAYAEAGGVSVYYGKPNPPIYDLALARAAEGTGADVARDRVLAIGDGVLTDVPGGERAGLDVLFVTGGLAGSELGPNQESPDPDLLDDYMGRHNVAPRFAIGRLR